MFFTENRTYVSVGLGGVRETCDDNNTVLANEMPVHRTYILILDATEQTCMDFAVKHYK